MNNPALPTVALPTRLRAVIFEIATAASAWHLIFHGGRMEQASIETQNFCTAAQLMLESFDGSASDLRHLLQAGIAALEIDACAASGNVNSALAHARAVLTECAKEGVL